RARASAPVTARAADATARPAVPRMVETAVMNARRSEDTKHTIRSCIERCYRLVRNVIRTTPAAPAAPVAPYPGPVQDRFCTARRAVHDASRAPAPREFRARTLLARRQGRHPRAMPGRPGRHHDRKGPT